MKEGWEYRLFKDVFPIKMGKTPPRGDSSSWDKTKETNNYWVSIADISQNEGKNIYDTKEYITDKAAEKIFKVKANSLLMSFKLSIGRMAFAGVDLYTNEAIIAIPESDDYNLRFLYYYLASYDWKTLTEGNEKVKGATLNKESIGKIKLPILSLAEQQQIVSFLDSEFEKIDALKANAETQLQGAKDLFQKALKEMLTPKDGWVEKKLGEVCNKITDGTHNSPINTETGDYMYVTAKNIRPTGIDLSNITYVTKEIHKEIFERCNPEFDDVLYIKDGATTGIAVINTLREEFSLLSSVALLKPNRQIMSAKYLCYVMSSPMMYNYVRSKMDGAAITRVTLVKIRNFSIMYPSLSEQTQIVAQLDDLSAKVKQLQNNYEQTITHCNDLKQALLKKVFG